MTVKIYKITNTKNGMVYIGQTSRPLIKRWYDHCNDSNRYDYPLYKAMQEYGKDCFTIELIEEVDSSIADDRERYYIQMYHSLVSDPNCNGYNVMIGGKKGSRIHNYNPESVILMHQSGKTMKEIAELFNIDRRTVYDILHRENAYNPNIVSHNMEAIKHGVMQIDPYTGDVIRVYKSRCEAARAIGVRNHSHISEVANGKKETAYGYIWKNV